MDAIKEQKLIRLIDYYEQRIEALDVRCTNLEAILTENFENLIITEINKLWAGSEELSYRVLFTMQHFQFRKIVETALRDANDKPVTEEVRTTLYGLYEQQREQFIAKVKADEEANATLHAGAAGSRTSTLGEGVQSGVSADAAAAGAQNGPRESTLILPGDFRKAH